MDQSQKAKIQLFLFTRAVELNSTGVDIFVIDKIVKNSLAAKRTRILVTFKEEREKFEEGFELKTLKPLCKLQFEANLMRYLLLEITCFMGKSYE